MKWHTYILKCNDGTYYTGITTDLVRRLREHNTARSAAKYTRIRRPLVLVYTETFLTRGAAQKREYAIKQLTHQEKQALILFKINSAPGAD